ncbi:uncharacterized protein RCO7_02124 [Rhynchosporium graminicola]|uniref:Uncharacterized protein n=1 Tax=Rhynchosporium graminicola TaxID=2792576 RepID=A0A1E1KWU3_9HELO|nr:uncharacterized protein RCO7_02124 [Rhynchosporium commune]
MDSKSLPFRPFSFEPEDPGKYPSISGTERSIPSGASQPSPRFAANCESKDKPSVPHRSPRRSQVWNEATKTWETVSQELPGYSSQIAGYPNIQATASPRSPTLQSLPSPRISTFQTPSISPYPSPRSPNFQTLPSSRSQAFHIPSQSPRSPHVPLLPLPRPPAFKTPSSLPPSPKSVTFQQHTSSPTPPMTKSSKKILQLTGYDPRFERAIPLEHQQLPSPQPPPNSPIRSISSNSSGIFYSQADAGSRHEVASPRDSGDSPIVQSSKELSEYLTSSIYNISEHGSLLSNISRTNFKKRSKYEQAVSQLPAEGVPQTHSQLQTEQKEDKEVPSTPHHSPKPKTSGKTAPLPKTFAQQHIHFCNNSEKDTTSALEHRIPTTQSLAPASPTQNPSPKVKERTKLQYITLVKEKQSLFRSAKDSLEWGIYDLNSSSSNNRNTNIISPSRRHTTTPVSPMFSMESDHLALSPPLGSITPGQFPERSRSRRFRFGSESKHLLKSPSPFSRGWAREGGDVGGEESGVLGVGDIAEEAEEEETDYMPSPSTALSFKRRVSSTLKSLSPASPSSSTSPTTSGKKKRRGPPSSKKFVITNAARRADGPATPIPMPSLSYLSQRQGFKDGVMRGKEVLGKVGKSVVGASKEEKRRESLKKRIVVVGITDQSPDGRVAEWL